jgi:DNA polymerase-3 subunit delta'
MAFEDFPGPPPSVGLLQRSLERGRLAHAYLFTGHELASLEDIARTLAKTLNCFQPLKKNEAGIDCCDQCLACRKIDHGNHADVHWVRPESKSRIITVDQMREVMKEMQLKPNEAAHKVAIIVAADRLRVEAANAFLKTLEEPPARSVLILLSTEPQRLLETILSRCLRLSFATGAFRPPAPAQLEWLQSFSQVAAAGQKSLLGRYRVLDALLRKLTGMKEAIEEALTARSPLQHYPDAEKETVERWEDELAAAIEAEYRRQRSELLSVLQLWLRDVWLRSLALHLASGQPGSENPSPSQIPGLLSFPDLNGAEQVAHRVSPKEALENLRVLEQLQRWLGTNVQEALALEVGLLKLRL